MDTKPKKKSGRPLKHLPGTTATQRDSLSVQNLKKEGGDRKTFRFRKPVMDNLERLMHTQNFKTETDAVSAALAGFQPPATRAVSPSLYALHVDDEDVQNIVDSAVRTACRELDALFPGVAPDGGKGISSNFQGLLTEHVKAMLTGVPQARHAYETALPPLLADDYVFGKPFELPKLQGAGYLVFSPSTNQVLSAYSGGFVGLRKAKLETQFSDDENCLVTTQKPGTYAGKIFDFGSSDVDVLFSTYDGATAIALKALRTAGEAPTSRPLTVLAAVFDDERNCYVAV